MRGQGRLGVSEPSLEEGPEAPPLPCSGGGSEGGRSLFPHRERGGEVRVPPPTIVDREP